MRVKDIRDMTEDDLNIKIKDIKKELFGLNNQKRIGAVEKPSRFKTLKRDIARIKTVLKERDMKNDGKR
jgi:large subunit ribosomal protein L29